MADSLIVRFKMGKKKSLAQSKTDKVNKFFERRRREKRQDVEFPAYDYEIRRRICNNEAQVDKAVSFHLKEADRASEENSAYWLVVDVENYLIDRGTAMRRKMPSFWSWHEQWLLKQGVDEGRGRG